MKAVYIGTSGWVYEDWWGRFYPKALQPTERLEFYAKHFNTVEINTSFYRLLKPQTYEKWSKETSPEFRFSIKASRYITHNLKLSFSQTLERALAKLFSSSNGLEEKGKMFLWQLPPNLPADLEKLGRFLDLLLRLQRKKMKNAFEFRHVSWFTQAVYDTLKKYDSALVVQDSPSWPEEEVITTSFVYLRFHGSGSLYSSNYSNEDLEKWATKIKKWQRRGLEVYAYFNNDVNAYAPKNALTLRKLLEEEKIYV